MYYSSIEFDDYYSCLLVRTVPDVFWFRDTAWLERRACFPLFAIKSIWYVTFPRLNRRIQFLLQHLLAPFDGYGAITNRPAILEISSSGEIDCFIASERHLSWLLVDCSLLLLLSVSYEDYDAFGN